MVAIVGEIVDILTAGIVDLGQGIGTGINSAVTSLFITTTEGTQSLSVAGGIIVVFAAISLAVGLTTFITKWLFSLGARN